jgi:esterase/lipase
LVGEEMYKFDRYKAFVMKPLKYYKNIIRIDNKKILYSVIITHKNNYTTELVKIINNKINLIDNFSDNKITHSCQNKSRYINPNFDKCEISDGKMNTYITSNDKISDNNSAILFIPGGVESSNTKQFNDIINNILDKSVDIYSLDLEGYNKLTNLNEVNKNVQFENLRDTIYYLSLHYENLTIVCHSLGGTMCLKTFLLYLDCERLRNNKIKIITLFSPKNLPKVLENSKNIGVKYWLDYSAYHLLFKCNNSDEKINRLKNTFSKKVCENKNELSKVIKMIDNSSSYCINDEECKNFGNFFNNNYKLVMIYSDNDTVAYDSLELIDLMKKHFKDITIVKNNEISHLEVYYDYISEFLNLAL